VNVGAHGGQPTIAEGPGFDEARQHLAALGKFAGRHEKAKVLTQHRVHEGPVARQHCCLDLVVELIGRWRICVGLGGQASGLISQNSRAKPHRKGLIPASLAPVGAIQIELMTTRN